MDTASIMLEKGADIEAKADEVESLRFAHCDKIYDLWISENRKCR